MKKILFYFIFVLHLSPVFSQATFTPITAQDIANIKTQIKTKNEQIATLSCQFTQTKKMSVLKEPSVSKGNMFYKKSDKFRWDYTKNPKFIFAQNGKTIYTKSNDKVQIVKDNSAKLYEEISKIVMLSINGSFLDNSKEFDLNFQENKSVIKIILTPKQRNMKKFINTIELIIDKKTYLATQFTLNDVSGDITTIVFENIKTNQTIEDSIFILK